MLRAGVQPVNSDGCVPAIGIQPSAHACETARKRPQAELRMAPAYANLRSVCSSPVTRPVVPETVLGELGVEPVSGPRARALRPSDGARPRPAARTTRRRRRARLWPLAADAHRTRRLTFLSRRFDRTDDCGRLHFASAMTLLEPRGPGTSAHPLSGSASFTRASAPDRPRRTGRWRTPPQRVAQNPTRKPDLSPEGESGDGRGGRSKPRPRKISREARSICDPQIALVLWRVSDRVS